MASAVAELRLESDGFSRRCSFSAGSLQHIPSWHTTLTSCRESTNIGRRKHFLTACTYLRRELFRDPVVAATAAQHMLRAATQARVCQLLAYTLMPDHVHVLVEGIRDSSAFPQAALLQLWRQLSGFWMKRRSREPLWQEGYWDCTLRDDERYRSVSRRISFRTPWPPGWLTRRPSMRIPAPSDTP